MKKIIWLFVINLLCISSLSAWQDYDRFYRDHKNEAGVFSFSVPVSLLQVFLEDEPELDDVLSKVDRVSFLVSDENATELTRELNRELAESQYKDMIQMKDGTSTIRLKGKDDGEGLEEIIFSVEDEGALVVICVKGLFTYDDARELARSINTDRVREQVK